MSKKSNGKKSTATPAQGETFFDSAAPGTPAGVTNAQGGAPGGTNESPSAAPKRQYKPRAKAASAAKGKSAIQSAYDLGYKHAMARAGMGK